MASTPNDTAASGFAPASFSWEESFQDLSKFCSEPKEIDTVAKRVICKSSQMAGVDDELITPEIGIHEDFNFGTLSKPGAYDDLCLWDPPDLLEKSDLVPITVDGTQTLEEPTDDMNRRSVSPSDETVVQTSPEHFIYKYEPDKTLNNEETTYMSDMNVNNQLTNAPVVETSFTKEYELLIPVQINDDVYQLQIQPQLQQQKQIELELQEQQQQQIELQLQEQQQQQQQQQQIELQLQEEQQKQQQQQQQQQQQIEMQLQEQQLQEQQCQHQQNQHQNELVMQPLQRQTKHPPDFRKRALTKLALNLQVAPNTSEILNTPDVMATLDSQDFNLLSYILESPSTGSSASDFPTVNTADISYDATNPAVHAQGTPQDPTDLVFIKTEPDTENQSQTRNLARKGKCLTPSYTVISSENNTPNAIRLVIKQQPTPQLQPARRSTRKRNSTNLRNIDNDADDDEYTEKLTKSDVNDIDDNDDDDDFDVHLPVKRRRHSSTCSRESKPECSRYRELRDRNNEASRRSRMNRKVREEEMKTQAAELELENQRLRVRAEELEKLVNTLRKALLTVMVKGKD